VKKGLTPPRFRKGTFIRHARMPISCSNSRLLASYSATTGTPAGRPGGGSLARDVVWRPSRCDIAFSSDRVTCFATDTAYTFLYNQMITGQKLSPLKLHSINSLLGFFSNKTLLLMCALRTLLFLTSSFVPVYAAEHAATGFSPTNQPGTGDAIPPLLRSFILKLPCALLP
jgi:hypothetical protein